MPLKAIPIIATALGSVSDASITDTDLQVVIIDQLQQIIHQLTSNRQALKNKINKINISKIKMLSVKKFSGKILRGEVSSTYKYR